MKYLKDEMMLLQSIKIKREDVKEALDNLLDSYNKVFNIAVHQQNYINKKRPEYAREMEDNFRLREKNNYLEKEHKRIKLLYKDRMDEIRKLEKLLKVYQKE